MHIPVLLGCFWLVSSPVTLVNSWGLIISDLASRQRERERGNRRHLWSNCVGWAHHICSHAIRNYWSHGPTRCQEEGRVGSINSDWQSLTWPWKEEHEWQWAVRCCYHGGCGVTGHTTLQCPRPSSQSILCSPMQLRNSRSLGLTGKCYMILEDVIHYFSLVLS